MERLDGLQELGQVIAGEQQRRLQQSADMNPVRERLVVAPRAGQRSKSRHLLRFVAPVLAAAAFLAGLALVLWPHHLAFRIDGSETGHVGAWIAAPKNRGVSLEFSDGSSVFFDPRSRGRVAELYGDGARVVLERGLARVRVVKLGHKHWYFDVGPFEVKVTGTRFEVAWDASRDEFALELYEGSVVTSGPLVGGSLEVRPGQRLRVSLPAQRSELVAKRQGVESAKRTAQPESSEPPTEDEPAQRSITAGSERSAPRSPESVAAVSEWLELSRSGKFREALQAAERLGFGEIVEHCSAADLLTLADTARFAANATRASEAYQGLRRRFVNDPRAAVAAYGLGRIAFDQEHAYAQAARWFAAYLNEQPVGPLAREASGRLMEAKQRSGDLAGARSSAQRYLREYPDGPQAALAQELLGQAGSSQPAR